MESFHGRDDVGAVSETFSGIGKPSDAFRRLSRAFGPAGEGSDRLPHIPARHGFNAAQMTSAVMEKLQRAQTADSGRDKSDHGAVGGQGGAASPGLGLKGLLMVKRKMKGWKHSNVSRSSLVNRGKPLLNMENTYKMTPDQEHKFNTSQVRNAMEAGVRFFVNNKTPYEPKKCAQISKLMAEDIKTRIKDLNFKRYKLVCNVMIGQDTRQGMEMASLGAWNDKTDSHVSYTFKNGNIFCVVTVFGIYLD